MRAQIRPFAIATICAATWLLISPAVRADVITTTDNRTIKGIVTQNPETDNRIVIQTALGSITIQRSRIKEMKTEPKSQGYVHIGRDLLTRGNIPASINAFQQALAADPQNKEAQQALDDAQLKLDEHRKATREQAIVKIDDLAKKARSLTDAQKFEEAEQMLSEASKLVPTPDQRRAIKELISSLYYNWALAEEDKFHPTVAEEKYQLAIAANPQNGRAIEKLLRIWEKDPGKKDQVARIYEQMVQNNPGDKNLRQTLAELYYSLGKYEDASHHYLELYKENGEQYRGSKLEDHLIQSLDRLHLQYAKEKKYDEAINYYKMLMTIDPNTDPGGIIYYEYLKRSNELKQGDNDARLALAQWAEKNGLDKEAITQYKLLFGVAKYRKEAQAGLDRYAERRMADAEAQFKRGNYQLASTLAQQVRSDFPNSENVSRRITTLLNVAQAQMQQIQQAAADRAARLVDDANEFKRQADVAFNQIFYTQHQNIPYLSSPRQEAIRYYNLAIQTYEEAIRIDPTLTSNPRSVLMVRLQDCRDRIARLTSQPVGRQNFGTPSNIPSSSIPPMQR
ncbi:tetratricopeptide repeat protein [bacterium]|nr:tetratricopeptide repeat protein [bacterium]